MSTIRTSLLLLALLPVRQVLALDFSGRFAMFGSTAQAERGDYGYVSSDDKILTADQQSVRLMLEQSSDTSEWSAHLRALRSHIDSAALTEFSSTSLFRYDDLGGTAIDETSGNTVTQMRYEFDRLAWKSKFDNAAVSIGRQAIDWGSGRFWQPTNLFGSFAPTDLDTDYKPGIDAVVADYYPSSFSVVTAAWVSAPRAQSDIENSAAIHYRGQLGDNAEVTLVGGSVAGNRALGGSIESSWEGMGWRLEGVGYEVDKEDAFFWIAGLDYQFDNGTLLAAEFYDNQRGATTEAELSTMATDLLVVNGLQQQLSRHLIGVSLSKELTPLLNGSYTLLASIMDSSSNNSTLHQVSLTYSVSNESDLLASIMVGEGKGLSAGNQPRSEFGYLPTSISLRLRFYF